MAGNIYSSSSFVGISLWLVPTQPALAALRGVVEALSLKHCSPTFTPHCTLLAGLEGSEEEVVAQTRAFAATQGPVHFPIEGVSTKHLYFQSVFALIRPTAHITQLHEAAVEAFALPEGGPPYMPHVSLFYGDVPDDTRAAIRNTAEQLLTDAGMAPASEGCGFDVDAIEVWSTAGTVDQWRRCAVVPLSHGT